MIVPAPNVATSRDDLAGVIGRARPRVGRQRPENGRVQDPACSVVSVAVAAEIVEVVSDSFDRRFERLDQLSRRTSKGHGQDGTHRHAPRAPRGDVGRWRRPVATRANNEHGRNVGAHEVHLDIRRQRIRPSVEKRASLVGERGGDAAAEQHPRDHGADQPVCPQVAVEGNRLRARIAVPSPAPPGRRHRAPEPRGVHRVARGPVARRHRSAAANPAHPRRPDLNSARSHESSDSRINGAVHGALTDLLEFAGIRTVAGPSVSGRGRFRRAAQQDAGASHTGSGMS